MSDFAMGAVIVGAVWLFLSVAAAVAWVSLKVSKRRDRRIQAERDAANVRTWAHIVESADADWRAWRVEMEESR